MTVRAAVTTVAVAGLLLTACPAHDPEPTAVDETPTPVEEPDPTPVAPGIPDLDRELVQPPQLATQEFATGLAEPIHATAPPGDDRLFVVERHGTVRVVGGDGDVADDPFVDLSGRLTSSGLEQGLLGLAFHPDFPDDDRIFVHYTGARTGETVLSELRVTDPDRADPDSEEVLLTVDQPAGNHNGGMVTFGPDGMLYLAIGDGGGAGDQYGQGQDPSTLLGAILRLDVSTPGGYEVPDDNPWADGGDGAPEVWAYGLRNPWKITFDHEAELLYIADVGQNDWQSVNIVPAAEGGLNHGWPIVEGSHCFDPPADCPTDGLVLPAYEYPHAGSPSAIIGGFVYAGEAIPELQGTYLYSDYGHGWLHSFTYDPDVGEVIHEDEHLPAQSLGQVYGFGEDGAGELYALTADGNVHRIVAGD